ncbi:WD repeat-containing 44 [Olea europaea subsp. europaea]|uniref:WD repeat-containing 44 n=1 Tax=Olea europaea subsp. europaea TaxID=158383 RepID=A0A8S0VMH7_OLEEU|nr:WD repeat-containing 44 [Olea europaea subsp. europaea]
MLSFDKGEEIFFDTTDYLLSEEPVVVKEDSPCGLGYEVWSCEPQSIKQRRDTFLHRMGFVEVSAHDELETMELERISESNGAISSSFRSSSVNIDDNLVYDRWESNGEASCSVEDSDMDWLDDLTIDAYRARQCENGQVLPCLEECRNVDKMKKTTRWWDHLLWKKKKNRVTDVSKEPNLYIKDERVTWMKMEHNKKRCMECTAVCAGQEINAHNGLIWTMKFSPDGKYLASGGEDGVICIWRVGSADASFSTKKCNFSRQEFEGKSSSKSRPASVIIPEKVFCIAEEPLVRFRGHTSDILDLSWSISNHLLSSSMDKTVRLWQVGSDKCLGVFHHSDYVTCVQFNPVDENYYISGSIDGKIRIWGVTETRVVDWANVQDVVTAICYQPNGNGFVVGSLAGICRFYRSSGGELVLNTEINVCRQKKSSENKITSIQFLKNDPERVMITSKDSKIRIFDGCRVVRKYRGLKKSRGQMSASFTSSGRHMLSVGDDSRIYIWNYDNSLIPSSKQTKSIRSYEHFLVEGVSVALPWSDTGTEENCFALDSPLSDVQTHDWQEASLRVRDAERFTLGNWFSMDSSSRASVTWPEEKLPSWDLPSAEHVCQPCYNYDDHLHQQNDEIHSSRIRSATWGLVIVTGGWDGRIRTFHNYGLPNRI